MQPSAYLKIYPCPEPPGQYLLYSTRRCSLVRVSAETVRQMEEGALPDATRETLARLGMLVADPAAERKEVAERFIKANAASRRFHAIVLLTLDCNLACPYCFEEGIEGTRSMSAATADRLVQMIERDHLAHGRRVALDFYGGEPLLRTDLIRSIARRLGRSSEKQGLPFSFALVTNGTLLTRNLALELKELGLKNVKITIDGPRDVHDRSRPFASGKGSSFDLIAANVTGLWDLVDLQIGGNFTRDNYRDFPRLLDDLLALGIPPQRLSGVTFNSVIGRIGGAAGDFAACSCVDEPWLHEASLHLRRETLLRGFPVPKPGPAGCMIELGHELVINVDGAIYKCPAFVGRPGFAVGSVEDGITGDGAAYSPDVWKKQECLDCAYLPQCFGGCRFLKFVRDGKVDDVDCWKPFLDATLEQCIRQDLALRKP